MAGMGGWVDAIAGSLAPIGECGYLQEIGRLSGRLRGQASLLQWSVGTCKRLVGCQAAFAGKPRSYKGFGVNASLFTTHQAER